jgi:hypothetical protein
MRDAFPWDEVREATSKILQDDGESPVSDKEWDDLITMGEVSPYYPPDPAACVRQLRSQRAMRVARRRPPAVVPEFGIEMVGGPHPSAYTRRELAVSLLVAEEAAKDSDVVRFREERLPEGLLEVNEVAEGISARGREGKNLSDWLHTEQSGEGLVVVEPFVGGTERLHQHHSREGMELLGDQQRGDGAMEELVPDGAQYRCK